MIFIFFCLFIEILILRLMFFVRLLCGHVLDFFLLLFFELYGRFSYLIGIVSLQHFMRIAQF